MTMGYRIFPFLENRNINIKIATLNCKNLSTTSEPEKFQWIIKQIRDSDADIISLQEINKVEALATIISSARSDSAGYAECHHELPLANTRFNEYIGFIYKTDRVKSFGCVTFTDEDKKRYIGNINKLMIRSPVYAKFSISNVPIIILAYHCNQKHPMYDCIQIKNNLTAIQHTNPYVKTCFILGDFNTHCEDLLSFRKLYKYGWKSIFTTRNIYTNTKNTTQYDHIWYHSENTKLIGEPTVLRHPGNPSEHAHSDHCLVVGNFEIQDAKAVETVTNTLISSPDMYSVIRDKLNAKLHAKTHIKKKQYNIFNCGCFGSE
jgi:endonuclease/exonuclease/phosphatase family metal-dependent hydrolase